MSVTINGVSCRPCRKCSDIEGNTVFHLPGDCSFERQGETMKQIIGACLICCVLLLLLFATIAVHGVWPALTAWGVAIALACVIVVGVRLLYSE